MAGRYKVINFQTKQIQSDKLSKKSYESYLHDVACWFDDNVLGAVSRGRCVEQERGHEVTRIEAVEVDEGPGVIDPRSFKHSNKNTTRPAPGM